MEAVIRHAAMAAKIARRQRELEWGIGNVGLPYRFLKPAADHYTECRIAHEKREKAQNVWKA